LQKYLETCENRLLLEISWKVVGYLFAARGLLPEISRNIKKHLEVNLLVETSREASGARGLLQAISGNI